MRGNSLESVGKAELTPQEIGGLMRDIEEFVGGHEEVMRHRSFPSTEWERVEIRKGDRTYELVVGRDYDYLDEKRPVERIFMYVIERLGETAFGGESVEVSRLWLEERPGVAGSATASTEPVGYRARVIPQESVNLVAKSLGSSGEYSDVVVAYEKMTREDYEFVRGLMREKGRQ